MDPQECIDAGDGAHIGPVEPAQGPRGHPMQHVQCLACGHRWPTDHPTPTDAHAEAAHGILALAQLVALTGSETRGTLTQDWAATIIDAADH